MSMRGIGGQFGVWVGRADYGSRRAGGVGAGDGRRKVGEVLGREDAFRHILHRVAA